MVYNCLSLISSISKMHLSFIYVTVCINSFSNYNVHLKGCWLFCCCCCYFLLPKTCLILLRSIVLCHIFGFLLRNNSLHKCLSVLNCCLFLQIKSPLLTKVTGTSLSGWGRSLSWWPFPRREWLTGLCERRE